MKQSAWMAVLILAMSVTPAAIAQQNTPAPGPAQSNAPIEITATKTVEWLKDNKQYVARENVVVTQGGMTIHCDLLTADYREGESSDTEIYQLTAEGNVQITDEKNTAYGDKAVYDVPGGIAVLTGNDLKLVSPEQTVTATDRMEYHAQTRQAKAIGHAKVIRPKDTLSADTITAYFKDDQAKAGASEQKSGIGGGSLDHMEADGNVVIKTATETLTGAHGIYRADSNTAELRGKVKVARDQNTLEGDRAEVNLTTNVSKMFGSEKPGGRVRGVFFPASQKGGNKGQDQSSAAIAPAPSQNTPSAPVPGNAMVAPATK